MTLSIMVNSGRYNLVIIMDENHRVYLHSALDASPSLLTLAFIQSAFVQVQ